MGRHRHVVGPLGLLFGLVGDGVVEAVPGVAVKELDRPLDLPGLIA